MLRFCRRLGIELAAATFTLAALGAVAYADAPAAPAPSAPVPAQVQLDITDGTSAAAFSGALAIASGDCASLDTGAGASLFHLKVCIDARDGATRVLAIDLDRSVARGRDVAHQKVQTTARIEPGKRIVLARFGVGADTTEIAATVK
jgi:hypothetical protein